MSKKYGKRAKPRNPANYSDAEFARAGYPWANWYISRGRMGVEARRKELRAKSWRRVF